MERETESQRFPHNHSYFLPIFALSRERIADFYVCLKIDYGFLVLPSSDLKQITTEETQKQYLPFSSARVSEFALHLWVLGATSHGVCTRKHYKLRGSNRRTP